ncbi:MAG: 6-carboxytetrahydropterin synthase QueD [Spirochaetaceae bacterium]|jgi:6-pyruvoyltetrahydropterin/6-carboxytetrahydropterin synthase|nr:6-carboxytetrahydropterin synthase QueD [Spirochaetaceae bacterium]
MWTIKVESEFAAAHFLSHYNGKCENLHGHNYRVRVWAEGSELDEGGMLLDFGALKAALREVLFEFDHTNLNDNVYFNGDPSAERIARCIFEKLSDEMARRGLPQTLLSAVDIYETPGSMARFTKS